MTVSFSFCLGRKMKQEKIFNGYLYTVSILMIVLFSAILITLLIESFPSLKEYGIRFFTGSNWDPNPPEGKPEFGALPFFVGTLITSFLALLICFPFAIMIAVFLGEYYRNGNVSQFLKSMVELLAGIPSVIYGLWGLFVFVPVIRNLELKIFQMAYTDYSHLSAFSQKLMFGLKFILFDLLKIQPIGFGMFTASVILAVMIIPYAASIGREVISMVPNDLKEAAYSMGATRFEVIRYIILPYCRSGIMAGILLALGRAIGETMAVTMVIGNRNLMPKSIFDPANTLASVLANEFAEAVNQLHMSSLIQLGLLLFITTAVINMFGKLIINKMNKAA